MSHRDRQAIGADRDRLIQARFFVGQQFVGDQYALEGDDRGLTMPSSGSRVVRRCKARLGVTISLHEAIAVVARGEAQELVGDRRDGRDEHDAREDAQRQRGATEEDEDEDREDDDDQQEAGAAARVQRAVPLHRGHIERRTRLEASTAVLGPVIAEDALMSGTCPMIAR